MMAMLRIFSMSLPPGRVVRRERFRPRPGRGYECIGGKRQLAAGESVSYPFSVAMDER
jgi:hypothetical protein